MTSTPNHILALNTRLCQIIKGKGKALDLITATAQVLPFTAAFAAVNRLEQNPIYLADTCPEGAAKAAVQRYVASTYLPNPIDNAFLTGFEPGLHEMADRGPDNGIPVPPTQRCCLPATKRSGIDPQAGPPDCKSCH